MKMLIYHSVLLCSIEYILARLVLHKHFRFVVGFLGRGSLIECVPFVVCINLLCTICIYICFMHIRTR